MKHKHLFSFLAIAMLAMFIAPSSANAQQRNMTIVSPYPDLNVKVKKCVSNDKTIYITLSVENDGTSDADIYFWATYASYGFVRAYDDKGNAYKIKLRLGDKGDFGNGTPERLLLPGVPVRLYVMIEGVPLDVEYITRLAFPVVSKEWGLSDKDITIRNIPITRQ